MWTNKNIFWPFGTTKNKHAGTFRALSFVRFLLAVEQAPAGNSSRGIAYKNIIYNLLEKQEKNNLQIVYKYFRKKIKAEK